MTTPWPSTSSGDASVFASFWHGGFECSSHITRTGRRLDLIAATQHDRFVDADYRMVRELGIRTVRDGVRWHLIDRGGTYDVSSFLPFVVAAEQQQMQVIWDLCHYGFPNDLDVFSPTFITRFAKYASFIAGVVRVHSDTVPVYCPINEISYLAWAAGQVGYLWPCQTHRGRRLKHQLVRAAIAGIEAIWDVDPRARIVHVDPIIHAVGRPGERRWARHAAVQRAAQFEAWDMLAGRRDPHLGGAPQYLDILGVNFYFNNQWETTGTRRRRRLAWEPERRDPRWVPLHALLHHVATRYERPLFLGETGHFGDGRGRWICDIAAEVLLAREQGVRLEGICLYPIIDRPDWNRPSQWHHAGVWDLVRAPDGTLRRVLNEPYARDFMVAQQLLPLT